MFNQPNFKGFLMEKTKIYTSSFRTGEIATKKQQMLFATDTAYALSEGYKFIKDCDGLTFQILDANNLVEIGESDDCECDCECCLQKEPTPTEFTPQNDKFIPLDNKAAIDQIINNTLNQKGLLRADQVESIFKLGQLKLMLASCK